jgi:hypothetical protein
LQRRNLCAPTGVVQQAGIARQYSRDVRMIRQKPLKALVSLILRQEVASEF